MKNLCKVMLAMAVVFSITACNTMAGAGQDIQKGGEVIEDAAK